MSFAKRSINCIVSLSQRVHYQRFYALLVMGYIVHKGADLHMHVSEFCCASRQLDAAWREVMDLSSVPLDGINHHN